VITTLAKTKIPQKKTVPNVETIQNGYVILDVK
jgi:hypothetical protein